MNAIETIPSNTALVPTCQDIEVTATEPGEMMPAQEQLIDWCKRKCAALEAERKELMDAYEHAVAQKWKSSTLKAHAMRVEKRITFYGKIGAALEAGYCIVPNFPVSLFAIRTDRDKPLKLMSTYRFGSFAQGADGIPIGDGEYKNPLPALLEQSHKEPDGKGGEKTVTRYWAEDFEAVDFPIQMAKPKIMEATTRAMALNIFDEFGILPSAKKQDPLIVGRVKLSGCGRTGQDGRVTFIVAWHLNTSML